MDPPEQDDGPIDPTNSSDELDAPDENAANMMSAAGDFSDEEPPPPAPIVDLYRLRGQSWSAFIDQMPEQLCTYPWATFKCHEHMCIETILFLLWFFPFT